MDLNTFVHYIIEGLRSMDDALRRASSFAITCIGADATPLLLRILNEGNDADKQFVIKVLSFLGPRAAGALPMLRELSVSDENEANRDAAKAAIIVIVGK